MTQFVCTICPKGCRIQVEGQGDDLRISGNDCKRGEAYVRKEMTDPTRTITSTVRIQGGSHRRCPVKTSAPIPKRLIRQAVRLLDEITLQSPVEEGAVVLADICGTGIDFVTTRAL